MPEFFTINYFKKKAGTLVFLTAFMVYGPLLLNQFVGDDNIIIGRNTFYSSWKNLPRLFERGYISDSRRINFNSEATADFGTGSVSYRPVSNLTYFCDYHLFQAKPYGSHLINILVHCVNSVLVYWITRQIFSSWALGLFAGLFFSLHPIQSEAVAVMSYRADILAAMFALFSFYFWIRFAQAGYAGRKYYTGSLAMFCLALFSKESAIMLPFVILVFDQLLLTPRPALRQRAIRYAGFVPVMVLYLYLYFVVFPNTSLSFHWLGGSIVNHCLIMGEIWLNYLANALFPWTVKLIPGLYCPPVPGTTETIEIGAAFSLLILSLIALWGKYKECLFFMFWYVFFYLPVSNLIAIANPMACRFMYLPSVGLLVVLAFFLHKIFESGYLKKYSRNLSGILHAAIILVCITRTMFLNGDWRSNFDVGWAWVRDYPANGRGYALLGREYLYKGKLDKAKEYLEKSVVLGDQIPTDVLALALCYIKLKNLHAAQVLLEKITARYPDYSDGYVLLMGVYLDLHDPDAAKHLLKKAGLYLDPRNIPELYTGGKI